MEGHTSRVEYSTAGSSGRRGWVQDFEVISQYTGLTPSREVGVIGSRQGSIQPSSPSWARASVLPLAQPSCFSIFRG